MSRGLGDGACVSAGADSGAGGKRDDRIGYPYKGGKDRKQIDVKIRVKRDLGHGFPRVLHKGEALTIRMGVTGTLEGSGRPLCEGGPIQVGLGLTS